MSFAKPDPILWPAQLRMEELHRDAAEARGLPRADGAISPPAERRFSGLHLHLGRLLIVVGRTITEEDAGCPDPACP
jgi:hypothetical protein